MIKILTSTALAMALTVGGAAYAGMKDQSATTNSGTSAVHKEAAWKAIPKPASKASIDASGKLNPALYEEWRQQAGKPVNPAAVEPDSDPNQSVYGIE